MSSKASVIKMCHHLVLLLLLFSISEFPWVVKSKNITDTINLEVYSKTDLRNQFALIKNQIVFQNRAPHVINTYEYIIREPELYTIRFYNIHGTELSFKQIRTNESRLSSFIVNLHEELRKNEKYTLLCKITYENKIRPASNHRYDEENQLMKFENSARFFSPYYTKFSKFEYVLKNGSLQELSIDPTYANDSSVVYIFYNTAKFDSKRIEIVFVNNDVFLVVTSLQRTIDVNHFGKITIEDEVVVRNNGTRFVGPYSPSFPSSTTHGKAASNWLYTHLPASAENIKFFDTLGNSSASRIYHFLNYMTLQFRTRYPLYGGWKTTYNLQYEVPVYEDLYVQDKHFLLHIRAIDYVLDKRPIDNAIIKIVLPEGAEIRKITIPTALNFRNEEVSFLGGLCVFGRPAIVLNGSDLFEEYVINVDVEYFLKPWFLLRAPLVISVYLEIVFVVIICVNKMMF